MSCLTINGIAKGCRESIGGVKTVYLANKELIDSIVATDQLVTAITTVDGLGSPGGAFYTFDVDKTSSSWTDTQTPVASNGGTFYVPSVTMVFSRNDAAKAKVVKLMGQATLVAIVKNNDGKYFLLGAQATAIDADMGNGLEISAGTSASGVGYADLNGLTTTLSGGERYPYYEVQADVMASGILA